MINFHLRVLGAPQLVAGDGLPTARSGRPRTLALLALAAIGGAPGVSRKRATAMLWPDSDQAHGGNSLRQELHSIRRDLGGQVLHQDVETLRIDPAVMIPDLWQFEAAVAGEQHEIAATLYRGSFMDGFYIDGLDCLERWIEIERGRLREQALRSLDILATRCERSGDHMTAVIWRRRLSMLEPLSSRVALNLLRTLIAAEDRTAALECAREHESAVRTNLDSAPDPAFTAFVRTLR
jgi:DNA-binding SARP family transcriptional activator